MSNQSSPSSDIVTNLNSCTPRVTLYTMDSIKMCGVQQKYTPVSPSMYWVEGVSAWACLPREVSAWGVCLQGLPGGVCILACTKADPPPSWVWAWRPPGVGFETPQSVDLETPQPDPSTCPLGMGLQHPLPDSSTSPWVWTLIPAMYAGIPTLSSPL